MGWDLRKETRKMRGSSNELARIKRALACAFNAGAREAREADKETAAKASMVAPAPAEALNLDTTGMDTPWPLRDVLKVLANAADHLLGAHGCDDHGHEETREAVTAARRFLTPAAPPVGDLPAADVAATEARRETLHEYDGVIRRGMPVCIVCGGGPLSRLHPRTKSTPSAGDLPQGARATGIGEGKMWQAANDARELLGHALYPGFNGDSPAGTANTLFDFAKEAASRLAAATPAAAQGALPPLDTYLMRRQGDLAAKGVVESLDDAEAKELATIRRLLDQAMASVAAQGALATPGEASRHRPGCEGHDDTVTRVELVKAYNRAMGRPDSSVAMYQEIGSLPWRCPATPAAQRPIRQEDDEDAYFDAIGELVERAPIPSTSPAAQRRPAREVARGALVSAGHDPNLYPALWSAVMDAIEADRRGKP